MNRVRAGYPGQLDDLAILRREPADTVCFLDKRSNRSLRHSSNFSPLLLNELPPLLTLKLAAGERFERPYPDSKSRVLPLDDPASRFQRDCFHTPDAQYRRIIDVMAKSPAICTRAICQFAVISAAIAVELRCKLDLKTFEFNRSCTHNLVAARRIELEALARRLSRAPKSRAKPRDLPQFTIKTKSPRFVSEAQKDYALLMCPRYMNVPLPAPCHVNVAGVGKQSVWGLRIIAKTQLSLWHHSVNSSIAKTSINSVVTWLVAAVFNSCIDAQLTPAIGR